MGLGRIQSDAKLNAEAYWAGEDGTDHTRGGLEKVMVELEGPEIEGRPAMVADRSQ